MKTIELPEDRTNIQVLVSYEPGLTKIDDGTIIFNEDHAETIRQSLMNGDDLVYPNTFEVTVIVRPDKEETDEN